MINHHSQSKTTLSKKKNWIDQDNYASFSWPNSFTVHFLINHVYGCVSAWRQNHYVDNLVDTVHRLLIIRKTENYNLTKETPKHRSSTSYKSICCTIPWISSQEGVSRRIINLPTPKAPIYKRNVFFLSLVWPSFDLRVTFQGQTFLTMKRDCGEQKSGHYGTSTLSGHTKGVL